MLELSLRTIHPTEEGRWVSLEPYNCVLRTWEGGIVRREPCRDRSCGLKDELQSYKCTGSRFSPAVPTLGQVTSPIVPSGPYLLNAYLLVGV